MNHHVLYRDRINNEMTRHMIDSMKDLPGFGTTCMKDVKYGYVLKFVQKILVWMLMLLNYTPSKYAIHSQTKLPGLFVHLLN